MTTTPTNKSSSFSQACNLLSQYLKEKRSYTLDLTTTTPTTTTNTNRIGSSSVGTTMNLFPQETGFGLQTPVTAASQSDHQMTIFYGGKVMVFDDLPADTVQQIMKIAGNSGTPAAAMRAAEMPIARKGSLQRFFEKRKDRISARAAPYEVKRMSEVKKATAATAWLGLGTNAVAVPLPAEPRL
ncbi:hypothetical protein Droror1_Dr00022696 [Drosera rotundifolia]